MQYETAKKILLRDYPDKNCCIGLIYLDGFEKCSISINPTSKDEWFCAATFEEAIELLKTDLKIKAVSKLKLVK
jgi:hypothetical protein